MATTVAGSAMASAGKIICKNVIKSDIIIGDNTPLTLTPQGGDNFCELYFPTGSSVSVTDIDGVSTNFDAYKQQPVIFGNSITIRSTSNYKYMVIEYGPAE